MRKYIFILALIFPFVSFAQEQPLGSTTMPIRVKSGMFVDSVFSIPFRDTTEWSGRYGNLTIRPQDNKLYARTGGSWKAIALSGGGTLGSVVWSDTNSVIGTKYDISKAVKYLDSGTVYATAYQNSLKENKANKLNTYDSTAANDTNYLSTSGLKHYHNNLVAPFLQLAYTYAVDSIGVDGDTLKYVRVYRHGAPDLSVSFKDNNTTYINGYGLVLNGQTFRVDTTAIYTASKVNSLIDGVRLTGESPITVDTAQKKIKHAVSGILAGVYTKLTIDDKGHATYGTALAHGDVPTLPQNKISGLVDTLAYIYANLGGGTGGGIDTTYLYAILDSFIRITDTDIYVNHPYLDSVLATISGLDTTHIYNYVDSISLTKLGISDSSIYTTHHYVDSLFVGIPQIDTQHISARIDTLFEVKLNKADSINDYVTPTQLQDAIGAIPGLDTAHIYYNIDSLYAYKVNVYDSNIVYVTPHYVDSIFDDILIVDTTSLSNRINEKVNLVDSGIIYVTPFELQQAIASIPGFDTTNIYIRLNATLDSFAAHNTRINAKVSYSDTSGMLSPYGTRILALYDTASAHLSAINARIKYSDSASMLTAYRTALLALYDTAGVHRSMINGKVNYTDTNAMLTAYRTRLLAMYDSLAAHRTAFNAAFSAGSFDTTTRVLTLTRIGGGTVTVTIPGGGGGGANTNIGNSDLVINTGAPDGERYLYLNENNFNITGPGDIVLGNDSTYRSNRNAKIEIRDVVNYTEDGLVWDRRISNNWGDGIQISVSEFDDGFTFLNERHLYLQPFGFELGQGSYDFVNGTFVGAAISSESNNISFSGNDEDGGSGTINLNPVSAEGSVNWYPQPNKDGYVAFLGDTANIFATKSDILGLDSTGALPASLSLGTITTTSIPININTGTGVTVPQATTSTAGLMSASDKAKLDTLTGGGGSGSGTVNPGAAKRIAIYDVAGITVDDAAAITANRALISDANGIPAHSTVTATELGYSSGVTSNIQTQLNGKASSSHTHSISQVIGLQDSLTAKAAANRALPAAGSTGQILAKASNTDYHVEWVNAGSGGSGTVNPGAANRLVIYPAPGNAVSNLPAITANRALVSNASGLPEASSTTATQITYLNGVTSDVQTQLNGKAASTHTHTISQVTGLQDSLTAKVPTARTLTINGTTYDLTANRSWTISSGGSADSATFFTNYRADTMRTNVYSAITNRVPYNRAITINGVLQDLSVNRTWNIYPDSSVFQTKYRSDTARTNTYNAIAGKENSFSKGSLIAGTGVTLTGTLTNRLVGPGDITISATGSAGYVQWSDTVAGQLTTKYRIDTMRTAFYNSLSGKLNISDTSGMLTNYWDKNDFTSTNISNWNTAYNDKINSLSVTGTTIKTITLTQQDGGTVTGSFTDLQGGADSSIFFTNFRADSMRSNIYSAIAGKIGLSSLSASSPLNYNNSTGAFSIQQASGSQAGYLSSTDWNTFNGKQNALGFTPENVSNKATNLTSPDNTKYPTTQAVVNAISGLISTEVDPNSIHKYPTSAQAASGWIDSSFRAKSFHMGPGTSGTTDLSIGETAPNSGSVNIWASLKDQYWDSLLLQNGGGTLVLGPASGDGTTVVPVVAGGGDRYVRTNDNGVLSASSTVPWSDVSSAPPFLTSEVDGSVTNELQTISRSGQTITLSNSGGSVLDSCKTYTGTAPISVTGTYPSFSISLSDDGVTNAKLANMAANSIKANATTGSDNPTDVQIGTNEFVGRASGNLKGLKMGPEFYVQNDTVRVQQTTYGVPTVTSLDPSNISASLINGNDRFGTIEVIPVNSGGCARIEVEFSTPFSDFIVPQLTPGQKYGECQIITAHVDYDNTDVTKLVLVLDTYDSGATYRIYYRIDGE